MTRQRTTHTKPQLTIQYVHRKKTWRIYNVSWPLLGDKVKYVTHVHYCLFLFVFVMSATGAVMMQGGGASYITNAGCSFCEGFRRRGIHNLRNCLLLNCSRS
jgi:hypothetical protein